MINETQNENFMNSYLDKNETGMGIICEMGLKMKT